MSKAKLIRKPNGYIDWSKMSDKDSKKYILSEMKKHKTPTAFNKNCSGIALTMNKRGWGQELRNKRGWKTRVSWNKTGKEEGERLMKKIASRYSNINLFCKEQAGVVQKARQWGIYTEITSCIPRAIYRRAVLIKMNDKKRLDCCKEIAKGCDSRSDFIKNKRLICSILKEFGDDIYEEVLKEIFGEKKRYTRPGKDRVGFLKLCENIDPHEPFLIHQVNQMVAYYVVRMTPDQRASFLGKISMKFLCEKNLNEAWNIPLAELWSWDWGKQGKGLEGFRILLRLAASDGANVPVRSFDLNPKLIMFQNLIITANPIEPETVHELFARIKPLHESIDNLIDAVRIVGHKKLSQTNLENLENIIDSQRINTDNKKKSQKKILKKNIEKFIKEGHLPGKFSEFKNPMLLAYAQHRKSTEVPIKKRTLDWYFFEMYKDWWHYINDKNITKRNQLSSHYSRVPKIFPCDLTLKLFQGITGRKKKMFETMSKDRVIPDDFSINEPEEYTIYDDKWIIDGTCINFTRIPNKSTRHTFKIMCKELLKSNKPSTLSSYVTYAQYLDDFLETKKIPSLVEFTIDHKNDFYNHVDKLGENEDYHKAAGLIKLVRKLYKTLNTQKKRKSHIDPDLNFPSTEYSVPKKPKDYNYPILSDTDMKKILDHLDEVRKMQPSKRIPRTAAILQLIISRRPGETVGLNLDCIVWLGNSGDWLLKYWSSKQNAMKKVSVSILCGYRQDPFALRMRKLVPELISEIKELTSTLRDISPKKIKNKVFIRYGHSTGAAEPIIVETLTRIGAEWCSMRKELDISTKITLHNSRHTMATRLLRTGSNYVQAAEALGDVVGTILNSYSATVSKLETMSLPKGHLINNMESDVKKLVDTKYSPPKVISDNEATNDDTLNSICGGSCGAGQKKMHACETYLMTKGGGGCKGCISFHPAPMNLPFWTLELRSDQSNMRKSKNTPLYKRNKLNYRRTENLVKTLKELRDG